MEGSNILVPDSQVILVPSEADLQVVVFGDDPENYGSY